MNYRPYNPYNNSRRQDEEDRDPRYPDSRHGATLDSPTAPSPSTPYNSYGHEPNHQAPPIPHSTHPYQSTGYGYNAHPQDYQYPPIQSAAHSYIVPPAGTYASQPSYSGYHEEQQFDDSMDTSGVHLNPNVGSNPNYLHPDTSYHGAHGGYNPYMAGSAHDLSQAPSNRTSAYNDNINLLHGNTGQSLPQNRYQNRPQHQEQDPQQQHYYDTNAAPGFQGGRVQSFLTSGQNMLTNNHEYAQDPFDYVQVPINGDSYALNAIHEEEPEEGRGGQNGDEPAAPRVVNLFRGNLVLDCPVSQELMSQYPDHQPAREFTHMRYSAATCDPANFRSDHFTLRQTCYSSPRKTELVVAITIYNEDDILLARTLQGVFNNIRHLCSRSRSPVWGAEAWKRVVVVIVADGRSKLNPRARALLASLGCHQDGLAKNVVNDKEVVAHLYEYTTMMRVKKVTDTVTLTSKNATPVQMLFCLKEKNQKKINSHRWLFQALCPILNPNVVVLLDAGTRPGNKAIYHLWKRFDRDPKVAGACGEIAAMLGAGGKKLLNPIVAAQNFEYKMSNILDKPTESVFGFITVLPGAFSAYRYQALQNDETNKGPLEKYFKGEKLEATGGIFESNMYLAEDRILCWALVAKRNCDWKLTFVKSAVAHTDVPETLSELVLQRRRWLNGSFFASIYAQVHMFQIWRTRHSFGRKLLFHLEFLFQSIQLIYSWFSLANFFLVFKILANSLADESLGFAPGYILGIVLTYLYGACVIATFVLSFGNRPQGTKTFYLLLVIFFAVMMAYVMFAAIYVAVKSIEYEVCINSGFRFSMFFTSHIFRDLLISLFATYILYILGSVMMLDPWHLITSLVQYILLSPTYVNVFNVYAFCNTHDISWGTKGDTNKAHDLGVVQADSDGRVEFELPTSSAEVDAAYLEEAKLIEAPEINEKKPPSDADVRTDYYAAFRSSVVLVWGFMNIALIAVVLNVGVQKTDLTSGVNLKRESLAFVMKRAGECTQVITTASNTVSIYLAVIMWSVAAMAAFKFIICFIFMCQRVKFHCCCTGRKRRSYKEKV